MKIRSWKLLVLSAIFAVLPVQAEQAIQTAPAADMVEGVWNLERIVRVSGVVETDGGFIFERGYYSTTVNYSQKGTRTSLAQFGTYVLEGNLLSLLPKVQVSTRGQAISHDPEPPFSMDVTVTGDEMRGVAVKDGATFFFRRLR